MDRNAIELMKLGAPRLSLEVGFKLTLERLARQSQDPAAVIDGIEKELIAANRNATPTPNLPNDVFLSLVEIGVESVQNACADVRRTLGIA